jgi:Na+-transporting methylmalonyl-CoA/oxaloacetate decarboxylase gamma subunit
MKQSLFDLHWFQTISTPLLRVGLVAAFLAVLFVQVVFIIQLVHDRTWETLSGNNLVMLAWGLPITVFFIGVAVQVALVNIWLLLSLIKRNRIFSPSSFTYVDRIIYSGFAAGLVAVAGSLVLAFNARTFPEEDIPPGFVIMSLGVATAFFCVALLIYVMRGLLAQAIATDDAASELRSELEAVI